MLLILAILTGIASTGATVVMLVFLAACAPNGTPGQLACLKAFAMLAGGAWLAGLAAAVWASYAGRHGLAAALGAAPAALCVALLAWLFATSG